MPLAVLVPAAWGAAARPQGPLGLGEPARVSHVSRLGSLLGGAGSVTGGIGVRMAFEPGRGRTAVPVRSALVGTTVAVAAGLAAVVFGASLIGLVGTPHRYGQNWAQVLDLGFGGVTTRFGAKVLAREPDLAGVAAGNYGQVSIGTGQASVPAIGIDQVRGRDYLTLLAGRAPSAPDEIVLGAQTLRTVHRRLGQTVRVTRQPDRAPALVRPGQPDHAHRRRGRVPLVQPGLLRRHRPGQRGRRAGGGAVRALPADRLRRENHLLQLLPAAIPARGPTRAPTVHGCRPR